MKNAFVVASLLLSLCTVAAGQELSHATVIYKMPGDLVELFAKAQKPNRDGAIGRNRKQYIHVRFQYRAHHLADYAVRNSKMQVTQYFIKSLEYAFEHQCKDGGFALHIPTEQKGAKPPSRGDLASGTAFFLASAASGVLSLEQSPWFQKSPELKRARRRLEELRDDLGKAADFLLGEEETLGQYDAKAPNRLFIDALAYQALGLYLERPNLIEAGHSFAQRALAQQDGAGYFIEGGGYDSSYNGVSVAVGFRLLLFQPENNTLKVALEKAVRWEESRILDTGEVSMAGNRRVFVGGESFLGKEKRIDVLHVVEGFALASVVTKEKRYLETAHKILRFYTQAAKKVNP